MTGDLPELPPVAARRLVDRGAALHRRGAIAAAESLYEQALAEDPENATALHLAGLAAHQRGHHARAVDMIERAIAITGSEPAFHCNLGVVLKAMGAFERAVASYDRAIALDPGYAQALDYRGNALLALGRRRDALLSYDRAIALRPDVPGPHFNRGALLRAAHRAKEALDSYDRAVALKPDWPELHVNRGNALRDMGRLDDAIAAFREAIRLRPALAEAHANLGSALSVAGFQEEALASFRTARDLAPESAVPRMPLLMTLNGAEHVGTSELAVVHRAMGRLIARHAPPPHVHPPPTLPHGRPLRVGYVSPDLHTHSVAYFLEAVLAAHDPQVVHAVCYHCGTLSDATTRRMRAAARLWRDVASIDDDSLARLVMADGIDILVDLAGHTRGNRLAMFQRRPASVQATWIGYPNTTGLDTIDYRITDPIADPPGATDAFHTERLVRLPRGFLCYRPPEDAPRLGSRPCATANSRGVTLGSFNALSKLGPGMIDAWSRILARLPDARLVLKAAGLASDAARQRIRERFASCGIDPSRLETIPPTKDRHAHLELYRRLDIALDSLPYNGTTTTCEALWMGVPVVSCAGDRHAARVGASLLHRVGLDELVARDIDEYVEIAVTLAHDPARIVSLGAGLRERMRLSPLCDAPAFARDLEAAYLGMMRGAEVASG